jgi:dolichyl-phosphate-mannose--protein O-mannosyl transferase
LFAGAAFGIGAACKWIVLYAGCGIGLLVIFRTILDVKNKIDFPEKGTVVFLIHRCAICIVAFVIIPAAIYLLAYLPFMNLQGSGHDLADVFKMQKFMFTYHKTLHATHPFSSPWWSWPFDLRPIWMYMGTGLPSGTASSIVSFGNPAIWWLSIPAIFATLLIALKNRDSALKVVLIALAFQYLPWVGINRLTFIYHFFSVIPFVILCIVAVIKDMNLRFHDIRAYFLVTGGFFIIYYPVLSGMNISSRYIDKLKLFPSWLF